MIIRMTCSNHRAFINLLFGSNKNFLSPFYSVCSGSGYILCSPPSYRSAIPVPSSYATLNRFIMEAPIVPWSVVSPARDSGPTMWVLIQNNKYCSSDFFTPKTLARTCNKLLQCSKLKVGCDPLAETVRTPSTVRDCPLAQFWNTDHRLLENFRSIIQSQSLVKIVRLSDSIHTPAANWTILFEGRAWQKCPSLFLPPSRRPSMIIEWTSLWCCWESEFILSIFWSDGASTWDIDFHFRSTFYYFLEYAMLGCCSTSAGNSKFK